MPWLKITSIYIYIYIYILFFIFFNYYYYYFLQCRSKVWVTRVVESSTPVWNKCETSHIIFHFDILRWINNIFSKFCFFRKSSHFLFNSKISDKSGFFLQFLNSPVQTNRKHQCKFQEILPWWSHSDVSWVHFFCAAHRQTRDSRFRALFILILLRETTVMSGWVQTYSIVQTLSLTFIRVYGFQQMLDTFTNTSALEWVQ